MYTAADVVNGATYWPGPLAPNTWTTLYGKNLSWTTASISPTDLSDGTWPTRIPGTGVQILFGRGTPARVSYVSPTEISFLTPAAQDLGPTTLTVMRDGLYGPPITIVFAEVSPGLFQDKLMACASHPDGSLIDNDSPAHPGEIVVLTANGLGQTTVPLDSQSDGRIVTSTDAATLRIQRFADFRVTLDDSPVDSERVLWAGLATGFAGQYQIKLQLPDSVGPNPEIRVWIGDQGSPPGIRLAVQP